MIERIYFKNLVTFKEIDITFSKGLIVLSGPSGAGKSVFISAILNSFGYTSSSYPSLCELNINKPKTLLNDNYELSDEITIKTIKKEKLRCLIDGQNISKKLLKELFTPYVKYISVRDKSGFNSLQLSHIIDKQILLKNKENKKLFKEYSKRYSHYKSKENELHQIIENEKKLIDLIEYSKYEINKIAEINPQIGEEKDLLTIKQQLSKIDKVKEALDNSLDIFKFEEPIQEVYRLLDKDSSHFFETMNLLRSDFEEVQNLADELEEIDIEEVLDRLADLSRLKSRYGSIEEALKYKAKKEAELLKYENIEQDKSILENFLEMEYNELMILAQKISDIRQKEAMSIEKNIQSYLLTLKLSSLQFIFAPTSLNENGIDDIEIVLGNSKMATLSGGEFNRVRLALMATTITKESQGVLILDEIDANVSGDESIAIAQMIHTLSSVYQIFAISHQPHLSSKAKQHILVTKEKEYSQVKVLDENERVLEISRIIAGENPNNEAISFAKRLRGK